MTVEKIKRVRIEMRCPCQGTTTPAEAYLENRSEGSLLDHMKKSDFGGLNNPASLLELRDIIQEAKCKWCGRLLEDAELHYFDDPEGIWVKGGWLE